MKMSWRVVAGLILFFLTLPPLQAQAQEGVRGPVPHDHVISGSPLLLLAGWFNAEYERRVADNLTVGITGGWLDMDEYDDASVNGFLRFYPQNAAFTGFYLGGQAGVHNVGDNANDRGDSHAALGIGVDIGYSWLLGPGGSFYVGLGIGATHLFSRDLGKVPSVIPSIRLLNVGVAF